MRPLPILAAAACLAVLGVVEVHAQSTIDTYNQYVDGELFVANGQTKTVAHNKTDHDYRICVRQAPDTIGLTVNHDGTQTTVYPNDCADFEAKVLTVTPTGRIPSPDTALAVRFRMLRPGGSELR